MFEALVVLPVVNADFNKYAFAKYIGKNWLL
jgi:hypothetical protein